MKVLFLAPLFDRVNGMSLASEVFLEDLKKSHDVKVVNLRRVQSRRRFFGSFIRVFEVFLICWKVWRRKKGCDVVYFTISESYFGNLKDILIMLICYRMLPRFVIHLHGGGGMRDILLGKYKLWAKLNLFFLNKIGIIVVLGKSHLDLYKNLNDKYKLHIVPNFSRDELFINERRIEKKFSNLKPLKILIVSNFLPGKGHLEILEAFLGLDEDIKNLVEIDFAGEINSTALEKVFNSALAKYSQLHYHGIVNGEPKRELFFNAHVFCLPSYNRTEGQPISILEGYAAGCVVFTTHHGGIFDVFEPGRNGFEVVKKSSDSIGVAIHKALVSRENLLQIAKNNFNDAIIFYTEKIYSDSLIKLLNQCKQNKYR